MVGQVFNLPSGPWQVENLPYHPAALAIRRPTLLARNNLHIGALGHAVLCPVAVPAGEGNLRVRIRLDQLRGVNDIKLLVITGLAHAERLVRMLGLWIELDLAPPRIELDAG